MTAKETISIDDEVKTSARGTTRKTRTSVPRVKSPASKATISAKPTTAGSDSAKRTTAKNTVAKTNGKKPAIVPEERHRMISQAAYLISRRRGFAPGNPETDWIHAEVVIDMLFDVA